MWLDKKQRRKVGEPDVKKAPSTTTIGVQTDEVAVHPSVSREEVQAFMKKILLEGDASDHDDTDSNDDGTIVELD